MNSFIFTSGPLLSDSAASAPIARAPVYTTTEQWGEIHEWPQTPHHGVGQIASHVFSGFTPHYKTFDGQWHTYGLLKTAKWWIVYCDGLEFGRYPLLGAEMDQPIYPLLDVALNFDAARAAPGSSFTMYVDYVRIYQQAGHRSLGPRAPG